MTSLERKVILLIDDEEDHLLLARRALRPRSCEYELREATSGQQALEQQTRLKEEGKEIALVLIDTQMPGMDGPGCVYRLREQYQGPIIALSNKPENHNTWRAVPISRFLNKSQVAATNAYFNKLTQALLAGETGLEIVILATSNSSPFPFIQAIPSNIPMIHLQPADVAGYLAAGNLGQMYVCVASMQASSINPFQVYTQSLVQVVRERPDAQLFFAGSQAGHHRLLSLFLPEVVEVEPEQIPGAISSYFSRHVTSSPTNIS